MGRLRKSFSCIRTSSDYFLRGLLKAALQFRRPFGNMRVKLTHAHNYMTVIFDERSILKKTFRLKVNAADGTSFHSRQQTFL